MRNSETTSQMDEPVFKNELYNMWCSYLKLREMYTNIKDNPNGHLNSLLIDVLVEYPNIPPVSIAAFGKHLQFMFESHDKNGILMMPTEDAFKTWYTNGF